jgi:azurin
MKQTLLYHLAAAALGLAMTPAASAACEIDVEVGDNLEFSTDSIEVEASCETVTINLAHTGNLPEVAMGHNWVLAAESDVDAIANAGIAAGLEQDYLPPDDERILAATEIIGGGESTSISFSIDSLDPDGSYLFFCSFPGHAAVMRGPFNIL